MLIGYSWHSTQQLLLEVLRRLYRMPRIDARLATFKASFLLTVLALQLFKILLRKKVIPNWRWIQLKTQFFHSNIYFKKNLQHQCIKQIYKVVYIIVYCSNSTILPIVVIMKKEKYLLAGGDTVLRDNPWPCLGLSICVSGDWT